MFYKTKAIKQIIEYLVCITKTNFKNLEKICKCMTLYRKLRTEIPISRDFFKTKHSDFSIFCRQAKMKIGHIIPAYKMFLEFDFLMLCSGLHFSFSL